MYTVGELLAMILIYAFLFKQGTTPNQKLSCIVLYLIIIKTFLKNDICIS